MRVLSAELLSEDQRDPAAFTAGNQAAHRRGTTVRECGGAAAAPQRAQGHLGDFARHDRGIAAGRPDQRGSSRWRLRRPHSLTVVPRSGRLCAVATVLLALLTLTGCGYNQSGNPSNQMNSGYAWTSLYREDVQTVAVPVFTNKDFRRGIEFRLTEAVIKQLEAHAPYKVVPRDRADTILEGQVTGVVVRTVDRDFYTNLPREQQMTITIDLIWKDLRNGRILAQRKGLQQEAMFYPTLGEGEFIGSQDAIERFAVAIVQELQADW